MQKSVWIFGLIAGAFSALLEYLYFSGMDLNYKAMQISKVLSTVFCVVFALVLIKKFSGEISIARTMYSGVLVALVKVVVMIVAFSYLYYPSGEFYEARMNEGIEIMKTNLSNDKDIVKEELPRVIRQSEADIRAQFQPYKYGLFALISVCITGLVTSVLTAAFIATNMMHRE